MSDMQQIIAVTTLVCLIAGGAGAMALSGLRGRSTMVLVVVASLVPLVAVSLAVFVNVQRMFISTHDSTVVLVALGLAGLIGILLSLVLGRQVAAGSTALVDSLRTLGDGVSGLDASRGASVSSELSDLWRELDTTRGRLAASEQRERALERSRRELVAFMSHDLRTPLAGLRALAEGLEDKVIEPEPALRQMRQTVTRLDGLVGDLFELSRVSSAEARTQDDTALVSLVEVAHDVVGELEQHAQQREVDLRLQTRGDDDRLAVTGNGDELTRLLGNLVGNAVRHTAPGGSVIVRAERSPDGRTQVSVLDECGGIAEPDLHRVFEAGWRADPERSGADAGAGLGLAIAKGIAESHAGSISVVNVEGGCCFEVALPAAERVS
ncbi:putative two-component system sensor kinase [Janibacter sp. HTCC2649]|uniref:sensor histidine kinase n=1 Tax=Janibacter sp. HTCC2649 TaxID=313589 RepID=UPI000067188F|nr:HAMP domain-containing sensor histidine kinase [Janibacter sp. HTCC2649]EAP98236.1 putative two-component system sensor kinase [Janibacter sp. HTCC2649]